MRRAVRRKSQNNPPKPRNQSSCEYLCPKMHDPVRSWKYLMLDVGIMYVCIKISLEKDSNTNALKHQQVRVPQDAATRGTGTFPAQFPKHPLLRSKNVILLGDDKEHKSKIEAKKRYSRSMDSTDPENSVSKSLSRSCSGPLVLGQRSYELESKEWWAKSDMIAREKRFHDYFTRMMSRGLRVIKHGRDGRRQYRCLWMLSNERVCVTSNSPSYVVYLYILSQDSREHTASGQAIDTTS